MVQSLGADPIAIAQKIDSDWTQNQRAAMSLGAPADWANESFGDARLIYAAIYDRDLPGDYTRRQDSLLRDRLEKAGLRLARLLNEIFR